MKKLIVGGAVAALAVAFAPAVAQPAPPPPPGVAPGVAPLAQQPREYRDVRVKVMSDRVMTRAEVSEHVGKLFATLDTNRDGFITREEVEAHHKMIVGAEGIAKRFRDRGMLIGDRGAMFDRLDTNKDGSISRQEFMASQPRVRQERVFLMREGAAPGAPGEPGMRMRTHSMGMGGGFGGLLFDMADTNKDGRVSLAEAQAAALTHFDKADLNHDGRITPDERQQMHKLRLERRQS